MPAHPSHRFTVLSVLALLGVGAAVSCDIGTEPTLEGIADEMARRKGTLNSVVETDFYYDGSTTIRDVYLSTTSDLFAAARVRKPISASAADPRAGVVVVGGISTGRSSVNLVQNDIQHVAVGVNYPGLFQGNDRNELVGQRDALYEAARDIPAMLMLLVDYLETLDHVDPERIAIIGVSAGGFVAPVTAAIDHRFRNVALMYSGADIRSMVDDAADRWVSEAIAALASDLALLGRRDLDPIHWVGHISPRYLLMVNGARDERMFIRGAERLYEAAAQPKEMIWLPTGHLVADDTVLIHELVDTALARLPILQD